MCVSTGIGRVLFASDLSAKHIWPAKCAVPFDAEMSRDLSTLNRTHQDGPDRADLLVRGILYAERCSYVVVT